MADSVSQDQTHQEGVDHIKDTLANKQTHGTTEDTSAVDFRNNYVNPAHSSSTATESTYADTSTVAAGSTGAGSTFDSSAPSGTTGDSTTGAGSTFDSSSSSAPRGTVDETHTGAGNTFDSESKGVPQAEHAVEKNQEEKEDTSGEKKPKTGANPKLMENRDAIPTAGGQKLGEKHWGESQVVAENPKPQQDAAGVSSKEGQPTSETADNTAKNTGGASGGPHSGGANHDKPGMAEKIKDKLPFGKK